MLVIVTHPSLFARPSRYFKLGLNYSSFRTDEEKSQPGIIFGCGKDFYPIRSFNGFYGFEVGYSGKRLTLENKDWPTHFDTIFTDVSVGDLRVSLGYLEILLRMGYMLRISCGTDLIFYVGPSLLLPVYNGSNIREKRIFALSREQMEKYKFDYCRVYLDEEGRPYLPFTDPEIPIGRNLNFGFRLNWKKIFLDFSYCRASNATRAFESLSVKDKLDSFQSSIGVAF
jgi:hypothetical protein